MTDKDSINCIYIDESHEYCRLDEPDMTNTEWEYVTLKTKGIKEDVGSKSLQKAILTIAICLFSVTITGVILGLALLDSEVDLEKPIASPPYSTATKVMIENHLLLTTKTGFFWEINGPVQWSRACYFIGNGIKNVTAVPELCGPICEHTCGCTHFVYDVNQCWLKTSSVTSKAAILSNNSEIICGILTKQPSCSYNKDQVTVHTATNIGRPIDWQGNWAKACSFNGNDLEKVTAPGSECSLKCEQACNCTNYVFTMYNGGTCWLKTGQVGKTNAINTFDFNMVCGLNNRIKICV